MTTAAQKAAKTWFPIGKGPHERELRHQLQGLRHVIDEVGASGRRGRPLSVLDAACAEGLIGLELLKAGAARVHGVELVPERVADARRLAAGAAATFEEGDLRHWATREHFDVVLALSILHKLPDPVAVAERLARACDRMLVIRLPPPPLGHDGGVILDRRSGNRLIDLRPPLAALGLNLEEEVEGYLDEWIGFWRRKWPTT